jgi:ATP-binding cassette subfamily B protein
MNTVGVPTERSKDFSATARRLLRRLQPDRWSVASGLAMCACSVALLVIGPRLLGAATDVIVDGVRNESGVDRSKLRVIVLWAVAAYVAGYLLGYAQNFLVAGVVQRAMRALRNDAQAALHEMPLGYVDGQSRGDLLSRVTNDIDNVSQSLQQSISQLLTGVLSLFGVMLMMFTISWELALVAVVSVPASLFVMRAIAGRAKAKFIAQWRHTGQLNAQVEETFTGHAVVKAYGRQREMRQAFEVTNTELYRASFAAQFISGCVQPATVLLGGLNFVAVAVIGGLKVANGSLSIGEVQAFVQYSRQFAMPLQQTASMVNVLQSGVASAERVFEVLDAPRQTPDSSDSRTTADQPLVVGKVEFDDVSFRYEADRPLIEHLSLTVEPGHTVAIVGPTGAGKTTLVNLLMRFYELDSGRITIDGREIAAMPRDELRNAIGMVLQDTWLFGGTIRENLRYGNTDASDDDLLAAAKACYVDRFVHSLPHGYDTVLDDEGSTVSAGEKQLLTIARAFLGNRSILVLDEATSSVDTRTELLIQRAMARLRGGRTSFVIAHRLSTIRDADTILVMDSGQIVEQGSHQQLLERRGAYYELYQAQFAGAATG